MSLTEIQKNYLMKRKDADSTTRSRYDFKMVQKLKSILDDVRDAYWILKFMPAQSVQKVITDDQVFSTIDVSTMLMRRMNYKKIRSVDDDSLIVFRDDEAGRLQSVAPSDVDLQRARKLYEHLYDIECFVDPSLIDRVQIPGYERPKTYPGGLEDSHEKLSRLRYKEGIQEKIKSLLGSGIKDTEQIAKEVGLDSWDVWQIIYQIQENERKIERLRQDIINLKKDVAAIERIRMLSAENVHPISIAVDVNHPIEAVRAVINKIAMELPR